ncbi:MAG: IS256 family transposase [Candidatus Scatovivens sp.]
MAKKELSEEEKIDNQIVELLMKKGMKSAHDISNTLNSMYGKVVQKLLDEEFNEFMEYDKGSHKDKKDANRRNGSTSKGKKVKTDNGEITIIPPRDRDGKFEPQIVKKRQKVLEGFDNLVISLYAKGNSLKDIKDTIQEIYSIELSEETLSNMTKAVSEEVEKWQSRPLAICYPFVYVDCLYCSVKEDLRSIKKAIYVALGVNTKGIKDVLGIWVDTTESATKWCEIFEELKTRGVKNIFFVSMDGLTGLPEAVERIFPQAIMQRCIVHITRNIYAVTAKKECKEVIGDFKRIYTANNLEQAKLQFENFKEKYNDNKKVLKKAEENIEWIYRIFEYPPAIRKVIYTTNAIESLNAGLRKVTKGKGSFVNENALMKVLYLRIKDLQKNWAKGIANWKNVHNELAQIFEDRFLQYIDN